MRTLSTTFWVSFAAILLAGLGAIVLQLGKWSPERSNEAGATMMTGQARIGGPFSLVNQRGEPITEKHFLGKPTIYFFGFTHCPDVCPTTLAEFAHQLELLGSDGDRLNIAFVTVDPERDTSEHLALYLSSFDARITGLTGPKENVSQVAKSFAVYYGAIKDQGEHMLVHTTSAFLMDRNGRFLALVRYDEDRSSITAKLRSALANNYD